MEPRNCFTGPVSTLSIQIFLAEVNIRYAAGLDLMLNNALFSLVNHLFMLNNRGKARLMPYIAL